MPSKRKETERVTFFIPKDVKKQLDNYVASNYSMNDSYGAYSNVATQAISYFCSTVDMKTGGLYNMDNVNLNVLDGIIKGNERVDSIPVNYTMEDNDEDTHLQRATDSQEGLLATAHEGSLISLLYHNPNSHTSRQFTSKNALEDFKFHNR